METMQQSVLPPGPKGNLILGNRAELRDNTHVVLQRLEEKYGGIVRLKAGPFWFVQLSKPEYVEHLFLDRDTFVKINEGGNLKYILGNGLLTSEGEFWKKQRRLIQPVFHKQKLQGLVQKIADSTDEMLRSWEKLGDSVMDVYREMNRVTLDIVGQTLLSTNVAGDFETVNHALSLLMNAANRRRGRLLRIPQWVPLPAHLRLEQARKMLNDTVVNIINKRRQDKNHYDDLLTMLMEVEDADTRERMTDEQLRDEVLTIFIAGHETTANAMAFVFYLLAKHPDVQARVREEAQRVLTGNEMNYELLGKMEYAQMVIKEAMRLYPPAWVTVRDTVRDTVVDGYLIKKSDKIVVSPYVMHHNPKYWENPEQFDPERFTPERFKQLPKYAYFPFGGGARLCIGNNFAMMEMQIILALAVLKNTFALPEGFKLEIKPVITLRPKNGMPLKVDRLKA